MTACVTIQSGSAAQEPSTGILLLKFTYNWITFNIAEFSNNGRNILQKVLKNTRIALSFHLAAQCMKKNQGIQCLPSG